MSDDGLRGLDLLDAAIGHIEAHPEDWNQAEWRCATGMCLAGWICQLGGGEWVGDPGVGRGEFLKADPAEEGIDILVAGGQRRIHAADRAKRLLGFDPSDEGADLFWHSNTLADIKRMRDDLRAGAGES